MEILIVVISWLLFGCTTCYFASQRGRDPFAWFIIGMLLGVLGILLLFLLPPVIPEEKKEIIEGEEGFEPEISPKDENPFPFKLWFYLDQARNQCGPIGLSSLKREWNNGKLNKKTLVWSEGMNEWKAIYEVPDLNEALS